MSADDSARDGEPGKACAARTGDASSDRGGVSVSGVVIGNINTQPAPTLESLLQTAIEPGGSLPRVRDIDPHRVGATPTGYSMDGIAPYVARAVDERLRALLRRTSFVLVTGPTTAGKSRSAFEAVRAVAPNAAFVHPVPSRESVQDILRLDEQNRISDGELVIWLDDLQHYLGAGALDLVALDLAERRRPRAVVVATMPAHRPGMGDHGLARLVLGRAVPGRVELDREPRTDERERAQRLYPDEDFGDATVGIAERLVAAYELVDRLNRGPDEQPHGAAVARAAIYWSLMGSPGPLTGEHLRRLYDHAMRHLVASPDPSDAGFTEGLDWARRPVASRVAILSRAGDGYVVLDYLVEYAREQDWPIPDAAWAYTIRVSDTAGLVAVGAAAMRAGCIEPAEVALCRAAAAGESRALLLLGDVAAHRDEVDRAANFYRRAVEAGEPAGNGALGLLLTRIGRDEEAEPWLRRALHATGDPLAAGELARISAGRGDLVQAEHWCRTSWGLGLPDSAIPLAKILADTGRADEAVRLLHEAGRSNGTVALRAQAAEAALRGDPARSRRLLSEAAQAGDLTAAYQLAHRMLVDDEYTAAEPLLRQVVDGGGSWVAGNDLGVVLDRLGRIDEAIKCYRAVADVDPLVAVNLGEAYAALDDTDEAERWFTRAAEHGNVPALLHLGRSRAARGDRVGARRHFETAATAGASGAAAELGLLAEQDGDIGGQLRWFGRAAREGDPHAAARLAAVLAAQGRLTAAEYWYRQADRDHDPRAAHGLRRVRRRRQLLQGESLRDHVAAAMAEPDEEELTMRLAAERGDAEAMVALAKLLAARDDPAGEQLAWWGRAFAAGHPEAVLLQGTLFDAAGRPTEALPYFEAAARAGDVEAAERAAVVLYGLGDTTQAEHWWQVAAEAGRAGSAHNLSVLARSRGDAATAHRWGRRGAEAGLPVAMTAYGLLLRDDGQHTEARQWLRRAAEAGDAPAATELGRQAYFEDDEEGALHWLRRAVEQDEPLACFLLGAMDEQRGDTGEAIGWYELAAGHAHAEATYRLALLIETDGDLPRAESLYLHAAATGHAGAAYSIADLQARRGLHDLAEHWYRRAAEAGHGRAALHVGVYLNMRGADDAEVSEWYARWTRDETGVSMRFVARAIDPTAMSVLIQHTRREPGGDALYVVRTPAVEYRF